MSETKRRHKTVIIEDTLWGRIERLADRTGETPTEALGGAIEINEYLVHLVVDKGYAICPVPWSEQEESPHLDALRYSHWLRENAHQGEKT